MKSFNLLGILIEKKTDVLAFAAFVISIGALATQCANFVKGPELIFITPKQVFIMAERYVDDKKYVRISAKMTYLNSGSPGFSSIVISETGTFELAGRKYLMQAQDYIHSVTDDNNPKLLKINKLSDANPVQVMAGAVVTHETYFAPWPSVVGDKYRNYLLWADFVKMLSSQQSVRFVFQYESYNGQKGQGICEVVVAEFLEVLKENKWASPVCWKYDKP